jgi:hypothetical protein
MITCGGFGGMSAAIAWQPKEMAAALARKIVLTLVITAVLPHDKPAGSFDGRCQ